MNWLIRKGLRILMYHKISDDESDFLTVTKGQFIEQISFLQSEGYCFVSGSELSAKISKGEELSSHSVLITFDDAYENNFEFLKSLAGSKDIKFCIFVPTNYIGKSNVWDQGAEPIMSVERLKDLVSENIELALHSHSHKNFREMTIEEIEIDLKKNMSTMNDIGLPYVKALAYPFGAYLRKKKDQKALEEIFEKLGLQWAVRIGNRVNPLKEYDHYLLHRIDVRGDESFATFQRKVKFGKIF